MRKIREILRLKWVQDLDYRSIGRSCGVGAGTASEYVSRARAVGLTWPLPEDLDDEELDRLLFPPIPKDARPLPDWSYVVREIRKPKVTLQLIWEEYRAQHPDGHQYSRFCELYQEYVAAVDPRMRLVHKAGEKLFVDYCGQTMPVTDRASGEVRHAQIFVAVMGASDFTFAEPTWTQSKEDWIGSHVRAFSFFGGVPEIIVPDNLKSGRDFLEILDDRYDRRSSLIVSQLPVDQWHKLIPDPTVADAALDRLIHNAHRIALAGDSARKSKAPLTNKAAKEP